MNRRSFLMRTALAAGTLSAWPLASLRAASTPESKLNCVQIGCGGRGTNHLEWLVTQGNQNVVALVDPDEKRLEKAKLYLKSKNLDPDKVQTFKDYRVMFDRIGKDIDAVFVATPNHHHASPAMLAMDLNKGVFCEKPLCHDIAEARKLRQMAAQSKAPTQMGNQGHCEDGYRRLCEFVSAGVVGNIKETHSWTDRANGGTGPRPPEVPVPAGLDWDQWIGPAPFRPYHTDLHPHEWHGWADFGNGSLGNMGCHVLDGVYWSLKLDHPVSIELEQVQGGTDERYPLGARLRYDFPARGEMPPVKVYWYEGLKDAAGLTGEGKRRLTKTDARNLPPLLAELQRQYPDEVFDTNGTLYIGDKGILYTGTYGGRMHLLPLEKMQAMKQPPRTLPRPRNVMQDFVDACLGGKKETAVDFDYASRLTEFVLLGNLAQRAGLHKKLQWNGQAMKAANMASLDEWIKRPVRAGWPG